MKYDYSYISKKKKSSLEAKLNKNYFIEKPLHYSTFEDAYIFPSDSYDCRMRSGGIVSSDGTFQISSAWHEGCIHISNYDTSNHVCRNENVIYIGCLYHIWGHAITDNFKKIWYLRNQLKEYKIVYITLDNNRLPEYIYELFELAGINLHLAEHITQPTKFQRIINPENSIVNINEERYYTNEFMKTIEYIKSEIPAIDCGKVYFTRTHLKNNRDIGEEQIEKVFQRKGYNIIAPEEHSIKEQVAILKGCTAFAATEGSISHSTLFCKLKTEIYLLRKVDFINPYSCFINQMCSLNVTYIDVHHSVLSPKEFPWRGPFYLYITYSLSRFIGRYGFHIPYFLHRSWYEYRYQLSERIKNGYYTLGAKIGIRSRLNKILK